MGEGEKRSHGRRPPPGGGDPPRGRFSLAQLWGLWLAAFALFAYVFVKHVLR